MSELDDFVAQIVERHRGATTGVRNGDPASFIERLSTHDPVTLFPASPRQSDGLGRRQPSDRTGRVGVLQQCSRRVELLAAGLSGDLAYLVGYGRVVGSIEGSADEDFGLRATQVYRQEGGVWKLMHRHADPGPAP